MPELTADQLARLDQAQAGAVEDLAEVIARGRELIAAHGPIVGPAMLKLALDEEVPRRGVLASFAALAVARIVELEDRDARSDVSALRDEVERLRDEVKRGEMYQRTYHQANEALDEILGPNEEDGAREGLVAEIWLVAKQRDQARAEAETMRAVAVSNKRHVLYMAEEEVRLSAELARVTGERKHLRQQLADALDELDQARAQRDDALSVLADLKPDGTTP